jgi:hypothetical protein
MMISVGPPEQPFDIDVASKSTAYRPSARMWTMTQFWLGRADE